MTYTFSCPEHGVMTIEKSMAEIGREFCPKCGKELKRIWNGKINLNWEGSYNNSRGEK